MNDAGTISMRRLERALLLLEQTEQAVAQGRPADQTLAALYAQNRQFGGKDRRLYSAAVFSWFRWKGLWQATTPALHPDRLLLAMWLDDHPLDPPLRARLPDTLPEHPPHTTQEKIDLLHTLCPECRHAEAAALVPAWAIRACMSSSREHKQDFQHHFIEAAQQRPPTWLRVKKNETPEALERLREALPDLMHHPAIDTAYATHQRFHLTTLRRQTGCQLEIQDLSSQAVGRLCAPLPGQTWWDLCAGAGGKALHLADLMSGQGRIIATDIRPALLRQLLSRARAAGTDRMLHTSTIEEVTATNGHRGPMDGILVDAPCSGIGTWGRNPDARWRTHAETIEQQALLQEALLDQAADLLKPGGRLVYSVCTLTRRETVDVAQAFLTRHPAYHLEQGTHPLYEAHTGGLCWIWPWAGPCNGMFVATFKRRQAHPGKTTTVHSPQTQVGRTSP